MLLYVCLYIEYNKTFYTVSELNVFKTDSRFDHVMLLMLENKVEEEIKCCNT